MTQLADITLNEARLRGALDSAPRPSPSPDADWIVSYMDWFFQTRIKAMGPLGIADGERVPQEDDNVGR